MCYGWLIIQPKNIKEAGVLKSGYRIFMTGNCSVPQVLMAMFNERALELENLSLIMVLTIGKADYVRPELIGHTRVNTLFISANVREAVNDGRADFTPVFLSEIPGLFRSGRLPLDVALIHVSPPDKNGYCSYGVEVGVTKTAAETAKIVIAEVNPRMPRTLGDSFIHVSKLDYVVEVDYDLPEVQMAISSPEQEDMPIISPDYSDGRRSNGDWRFRRGVEKAL
jgi:acetyl-CoA hydrolase